MNKRLLKKYFDFNVMYDLVVLEPYTKSFHDLRKYLKESEKTILMIEEGGHGSLHFDFKGRFLTYHDPAAIERVGRALYVFLNNQKNWNDFLSILKRWRREYAPRMTLGATTRYLNKLSTDRDFLYAYTEMYQKYSESCAVYLFTDGRYHEYSIESILKKISSKDSDKIAATAIFASDKESVFQKAEKELSEIQKLYKQKNGVWEKRFRLFLERFIWLYVADTHYDLDEIIRGLKKQLRAKPEVSKNKFREKEKNIKVPARLSPIVNKLRELGFQRMELRQYWQWQDYLIHKIFEAFEKKHSLPSYFLAFLTHKEVFDLMKNYNAGKARQLATKRKLRMKQVATLLENSRVRIYDQGADIARLKKRLCGDDDMVSAITGQVAYRSEKKIIGTARVIKWTKNIQAELTRFKQGEIMVVTQTKPDFLPYLRKALAIVADEGGITSHVAIVSRELRIPSVIGTRIATSTIKSGDKIEIDTAKGIVKILVKN